MACKPWPDDVVTPSEWVEGVVGWLQGSCIYRVAGVNGNWVLILQTGLKSCSD